MSEKKLKIVLVGGGSVGPVTPLLAVREALLKIAPNTEFFYFGAGSEPERRLLASLPVICERIPAGKWRRYFSWRNLADIFLTLAGFVRSLFLLCKYKPSLVFAAGSYTSVPVGFAAFLQRIPVVVHQQDVIVGLANRLLGPIASKITVSLPKSVKDFGQKSGLLRPVASHKAVFTGNPVREFMQRGSRADAIEFFRLEANLPTLLVLGGGTGAQRLNQLIARSAAELCKTFQIIHVTGARADGALKPPNPRYHSYEFLAEPFPKAFAAADIIVSRAGFATISEIVAQKKISILVPIPHSQQEANALYLFNKGAAIAFPEAALQPERLAGMLRKLLFDRETQKQMQKHLRHLFVKDAGKKIAEIIVSLAKQKKHE